MKTFNLEKFCSDLISLRKNTTQSKVAELLGINRSTLSLLEKGKQTPSLDIYQKFARSVILVLMSILLMKI